MELDVRLATGAPTEARARDELRSILDQYDVEPWTFTTDVVIREGSTPRSHPVLTLSTHNGGMLQLASYLHEQMHWFCDTRRDAVEELCTGELRERYPNVPVGPPDGGRDEHATYLHLIVCWLEVNALRRLLGPEQSENLARRWIAAGVYRWVYTTVLEDYDSLSELFRGRRVAIDPLRGEPDYSQRAPEAWEEAYHKDIQPWDLSRPHGAISRLLEAGAFEGYILDAGCGTAEDALAIAAPGHRVCGIDIAPTAIKRAQAKAAQRDVSVQLVIGDVLKIGGSAPVFDRIVDVGMFHILNDDRRRQYVEALTAVTVPGGVLYLLCFSEFVPGAGGPRRTSKADIRAAFSAAAGWRVEGIAPERYETRFENIGVPAWLAKIERI